MSPTGQVRSDNHKSPARLQNAAALLQKRHGFVDMLYKVTHRNGVETVIGEPLIKECSEPNVYAFGLCITNRCRIKINAFDLPTKLLQLREHLPITAAKLQ